MYRNSDEIEKRPWSAAGELRANSRLNAFEHSIPVLGSIFLRYAGHRFAEAEKQLEGTATVCLKNKYLRRTRDLFLPRLSSGELKVSEPDINIGERGQVNPKENPSYERE